MELYECSICCETYENEQLKYNCSECYNKTCDNCYTKHIQTSNICIFCRKPLIVPDEIQINLGNITELTNPQITVLPRRIIRRILGCCYINRRSLCILSSLCMWYCIFFSFILLEEISKFNITNTTNATNTTNI